MEENHYQIQQRVLTAINVFEELSCKGYRLCPLNQGLRGGFVVRWDGMADNAVAAYRAFLAGLLPILDAISVVTQCAVQALPMASFCVYRTNDNPNNVVFFHDAREVEAVGMPLGKAEIEDVERLIGAADESQRVGIGYLAEASRSPSPMFFLAMLVIAVEAFAGKSTAKRKCEKCGRETEYAATDRLALKEICSKELYDPIYRTAPIRHKLFHGGKVDMQRVADLARELHERLVLYYLKEKHGLLSVRRIVGAPRNISYEFSRAFVECAGEVDLLRLEEDSRASRLNIVETPVRY